MPPALPLTAAERRVIAGLRTPAAVQHWLNHLPYNHERGGETLRTFRGVVRTGTAHCLEATLTAAVVLEQHRYPPLVLSFESIDLLDHVIFVYRGPHGWGSVARSRDPGLHGRKPVFATPRALALSYFDGYIDFTGRIKAYAVVDLRVLGALRLAAGARKRLEGGAPAPGLAASAASESSDRRADRLRRRYRAFREAHGYKPWKYLSAGAIGGRRCPEFREEAEQSGDRMIDDLDIDCEMIQSRSKSRVGLVIGSFFAWRSASSNRRASASSRVLSPPATDCSNSASRRAASAGKNLGGLVQLGLVAALRLACARRRDEGSCRRPASSRSRGRSPRPRSSASP